MYRLSPQSPSLRLLTFLLFLPAFTFSQKNIEYVSYKTTITIEKNKRVIEESYLIKIGDQASNWISDIEISTSKGNPTDILGASILDRNLNEIRKLKKNEILQKNDPASTALYEDSFVKSFSLKWHEYPYYIQYSYRITNTEFVSLCNWYPQPYSNIPVKSAELIVSTPFDYEYKVKQCGQFETHRDSVGNQVVSSWKISDLASWKLQSLSPPVYELLPSVVIVPKKFTYGIEGSLESWKSFGEWVTHLNVGLDVLPVNEQIRVEGLLEGISDRKEKVRILYEYLLENTRYIYVGIGQGGFIPYPAGYVSSRKYGDCKALTIYMKALLKHTGIESYYTLVNSGAHPEKFDPDFSSWPFDHVILCVPDISGDTLWLENTAENNPTGYLGTLTQGRYGLLANGSQSKLVKIPGFEVQDVANFTSYVFALDEQGNGQVTLDKRGMGETYEDLKGLSASSPPEDKSRLFSELNLSNFELLDLDLTAGEALPIIELKATLDVKNQLKKIGNNLVLPVPQTLPLPNLESPESRIYSVRLDYPIYQVDTLIYKFSTLDYEVNLPAPQSISTAFGTYTLSYEKSDRLVILKKLVLYSGEWSLAQYPDFYRFISSIKNMEKTSLLIKPKL